MSIVDPAQYLNVLQTLQWGTREPVVFLVRCIKARGKRQSCFIDFHRRWNEGVHVLCILLRNQLQVGYTLPNCYIELLSVYNTGESFAGFLTSVRFAKEILILGKDYTS
jgi:hypothetical protein